MVTKSAWFAWSPSLHSRDASALLMGSGNWCLSRAPGRNSGLEHRAECRGVSNPGQHRRMSAADSTASAAPARTWIANQPYVLLSITALCWAGNAIVGRLAAGHIPPVTLSFLRWSLAFLIILPFTWRQLRRDWPAIRSRLGIMIALSITGIGAFNTLQYWSLEYTQALNTLLLQSAGP